MTSGFQNEVIVITGAGSGIGRELAKRLSEAGAKIAAIDCNEANLQALAEELSDGTVRTRCADVTVATELHKAIAEMCHELGPADRLIASAGVGLETSARGWVTVDMEKTILVNLLGVAHSIQAVLPQMLERKKGHIIALSSLASYRGLPFMAAYCASKAGVNSLMDAFRSETNGSGVQFTTLCPGWIRTPMTSNIKRGQPKLMELDMATTMILKAIRQRRTFYAFPGSSKMTVAMLRWLPNSISDWLIQRMLSKMK